MPRTASFNLNEIKSSTSSKITPIYIENAQNSTSRRVPQDPPPKTERCSFSCGWCTGLFLSACCLTFLILFSLFPHHFVPALIKVNVEAPFLVKRGYLRVYPNLPEFSTQEVDRTPGVYVINPNEDHVRTKIIPNIENVLDLYKESTSDTYPPAPYILCWLERPTNSSAPCYFDRKWLLRDCNKENKYGYEANDGIYNPCFILRLEDTEDWKPRIFPYRDVNPAWINQYDASHFAIGCNPSIAHQDDVISQVISYPSKGFPVHYFPQSFFKKELYLPPMVMMQVKGLEIGKNFSLNCWIRAQNSWYLVDSGMITIHFRQ